MKGIILAGGGGTRLFPMTRAMSKQMLHVCDKPMIYYPLSILMLLDIREILIISAPDDLPVIRKLLGDGSEYGIHLSYKIQPSPDGLAQAFILGEEFINGDPVVMILGDNLLYTYGFGMLANQAKENIKNNVATIFGYKVRDPERFGVIEFDCFGNVASIEEKPREPRSNNAAVGLYFYPGDVVQKARQVKPSARGELEITDLSNLYLTEGRLKAIAFGRGSMWIDAGTPDSLMDASNFVHMVEKRQGIKIACLEEVALRKGFVPIAEMKKRVDGITNCPYTDYLKNVIKELEECAS